MRRIDYLVLHHTGGSTLTGALSWLRQQGTSYHELIDNDESATVYQMTPFDMIAHHARGVNANSIGLALVGHFGNNPPTPTQIARMTERINYIRMLFPGIKIVNHRDVSATSCPVIDLVELYHEHCRAPWGRVD